MSFLAQPVRRMPDMPISLPYYLFVAFTLAAKPSRTRCNSAVKVVSSADEKDANTACNRVALASVALLMAASVAAGGYLYWDYAGHFESTDDAYIAARQFAIAPEVSGYITAVPVTDNERVAAGDVTARIDDRNYRIALAQAEAQVAAAQANIENIDAQTRVQVGAESAMWQSASTSAFQERVMSDVRPGHALLDEAIKGSYGPLLADGRDFARGPSEGQLAAKLRAVLAP
jgi:hypothetical protein